MSNLQELFDRLDLKSWSTAKIMKSLLPIQVVILARLIVKIMKN